MSALTREQHLLVESALDEMTAFARAMAKRLGLGPDDIVDVLGDVRLELVQTVKLVDVSRATGFAGYAYPAVRGVVLDAAAKRRKSKVIALAALEARRELPADDDDDADERPIEISFEPSEPRSASVEKLRKQIGSMAGAFVLSLSRPAGDDEMVDRIFREQEIAKLRASVAELSDTERKLIRLRIVEGKTLKQTAEALSGVSTKTVQRMEKEITERLGLSLREAGIARRKSSRR